MSTTTPGAVATAVPTLPGTWRLGLARTRLELRSFFRSWDAVIFTFSLPTLLLVVLGSVFTGQFEGTGVTASQIFAASMIAAGIMSTTFVSLAIEVATDRDNGTLKRLRGTPLPAAAYLLGKIGLALVTTLVQITLMLAVAVALYDLSLPDSLGDWWTFAWVLVLSVGACVPLGIAVSRLARSARSAPAVANLPYLVLQFISGIFVNPITSLPAGIVVFASFFPVKWMGQGFRSVFLPDVMVVQEAAGSWELDRVALVLGAWCVAGLLLCVATFRWTPRRDG